MPTVNKTVKCTIIDFSNDFRTKQGSGKVYQTVTVDVPGIGHRTIQRTLTAEDGTLKPAVENKHIGKSFTCYLTLDTEANAIYGEVSLASALSQDDINAFMAL